jgi:DNA-directed RNA polymerase specialized sigma24 family protein
LIPNAVNHYAHRMGSNGYPADDLKQDAALAIINAGGLRLSEAQRVVIGRNAIKDQMRRLRLRRKALSQFAENYEPASHIASPMSEALAQDFRNVMEEGADLPTLQVVSALTNGFTKSEAAERFGLSKPAVSRIVARLKKRVARLAS